MKKRHLITILAWLVAALTVPALLGCGSGNGKMQSSENIVHVTKAPRKTMDPDQSGNGGADSDPVSAASQTASDETSVPGTTPGTTSASGTTRMPMPTATPLSTPVPGKRLQDGEYYLTVYNDFTTEDTGRVWVVIGEQKYQELPDSIISTTEIGDVLTLRSYSFEVRDMDRIEKDGVMTVLFNDGTERCIYIEETNTWRFYDPDGRAYTYEAERYLMPIAVDARLIDEMTPHAEGQNVYGDTSVNDPSNGILDELQDYFHHYHGLNAEYANVTVYGGEVTSVVIPYRP